MQRDFAEPGGFGESLGNDVSRITAIVPAVQSADRGLPRRGPAGDPHDGMPPPRPLRLPAGQAQPRNAVAPHRRPGPDGPHPDRRRARHGDPRRTGALAGEIVIEKPGKGAFYATHLGDKLQRLGIRQLVFAGVTTEVCVQTTMREANDRGYDCLLAEDATESYFPEFKAAAIAMIRAQGAIVGWTAPVSDILEGLAHA